MRHYNWSRIDNCTNNMCMDDRTGCCYIGNIGSFFTDHSAQKQNEVIPSGAAYKNTFSSRPYSCDIPPNLLQRLLYK
jgi:hypothetical protein